VAGSSLCAPLKRISVQCFLVMTVVNYNGNGFWSVDEVLRRYAEYARRYGVTAPFDLKPKVHSIDQTEWIYPVMDRVIEGIENGDLACAELGIEFIEESASFAFGRTLKANTARALRRASLTDGQKERIRKRITEMLVAGYLPREFRQYAKLVRKIGLGKWLAQIEQQADSEDPWVQRYYAYFKEYASH
jgi:hypothetical protein